MELIQEIESRRDKKGNLVKWGKFYCEFCKSEVERRLVHGKKQKFCGCINGRLILQNNSGYKMTEKQRQKMSEAQRGKKKSKEHKQKISKALSGKNHPNYGKHPSVETKQKISKANKGKKITGEQLKKQSESHKGIKQSEEHKQKMSILFSGKNNPMYGKKGNLSPNWNNGSSFEPYSPEFNKELKQQILERDNYQCQDLNCEHKSSKLDIHHIDYDKKNNSEENLITLCAKCHSKTSGKNNRKHFTEFYQNIIINRIMECLL